MNTLIMRLKIPMLLVTVALLILSGCRTTQTRDATAERNTATVRRFLDEVVTGGRLELIDELWTPDMSWHNGGHHVRGRENYKRMMEEVVGKAFVEMRLDIKDIVAANDKVVVRFTNSGRNVGPFMGLKPANRRAEWQGIGIYRLRHGRIAEAWFTEDILSMLQQLDAVKLPTQ